MRFLLALRCFQRSSNDVCICLCVHCPRPLPPRLFGRCWCWRGSVVTIFHPLRALFARMRARRYSDVDINVVGVMTRNPENKKIYVSFA